VTTAVLLAFLDTTWMSGASFTSDEPKILKVPSLAHD